MSKQAKTVTEAFFNNVLILGDDDCWEWQGPVRGGSAKVGRYGQICANGTIDYAHRVAYEIYKGSIPKGLMVLHSSKCVTRLCCNPSHLRLGNAKENQQQRIIDGTAPRGEKCGRSKLTNTKVKKIRELVAAGKYTQTELAEKYNMHPCTISQIVNRKTWKHLP